MATKQRDDDRLPQELFEKLGVAPAEAQAFFVYGVKIVCGKQTGTDCCCVAGVRPGVYATEVNIQNLNIQPASLAKLVLPLINSGAVIAREPNFADLRGRTIESVKLPPLGATMDDCCHIAELLLGGAPSGNTGLTIALLTIVSLVELSVSAVYTANSLTGDRHQHRRRVRSVATIGTSWAGLVGSSTHSAWAGGSR